MTISGQYSATDADRDAINERIRENVPKAFWVDFYQQVRAAYLTSFRDVYDDPSLLDELKPSYLPQRRHCRVETVLHHVACDHGLAASPTLISSNNYPYVFVGAGSVCFVQHYVQSIGAMPKPAAFRAQLAAMNDVTRAPMLAFVNEPSILTSIKDVYGITTHNPVGRKFTEEDQSLEEIRFGVPTPDMKEWVAEPSIAEVIATYPRASAKGDDVRELEWRNQPKKGAAKE